MHRMAALQRGPSMAPRTWATEVSLISKKQPSCVSRGRDGRIPVNGGDKVGRVGGRLLSIGDLIVYRLPSFIGL